jgi:hypothetical protein
MSAKVAEDPGKQTSMEHTKEETEALRSELRRLQAQKEASGCHVCVDCGECRADLLRAKLKKRTSMILRVDRRVQVLLEKYV